MKRAELSPAERADWLRLSRTSGVGPVTFAKLIERFGAPAPAIEALPRLAKRGGRIDPLGVVSRAEAEDELAHHETLGARLVCACEPDFPASLAVLDPQVLGAIIEALTSGRVSSRPAEPVRS